MTDFPTEARSSRAQPAEFFVAQEQNILDAGGPVLDLACGQGRHALAAAALGLPVVAVDRNRDALLVLREAASTPRPAGRISILQADLEAGPLPPFPGETFSSVLVFRYLHRPLMPWIESVLRPGGLLIYETFTTAQRALGWGPKREDFLLRDGELPLLFPGLESVDYQQGLSGDEPAAESARLVARRPMRV